MNTSESCILGAASGPAAHAVAYAFRTNKNSTTHILGQLVDHIPGLTKDAVIAHRKGVCSCGPLGTVTELSAKGSPSPDPVRPTRYTAPKGWEPGIKYVGGVPVEITTADVPTEAQNEEDYLNIVKGMGATIPEGFTVILLSASYDPAAWHRDEEGGGAVTRPVWRYRFSVVRKSEVPEDADDILDIISSFKPRKIVQPSETPGGFVVVLGDMQIGKRDDMGGTKETIERILALVELAVARLKELRKAGRVINTIYIPVLGDCIEGFSSQNGRLAFRQDLAPTEQIRVYRRLLIHIVKTFAPLAAKVILPVVPGNHDDAQRNLATYHDDDFATEGASSVADALAFNPEAFGHVSFVFPQHDRSTVTLDMEGTIVGLAHGHQTKGGAEKWWANMAHGCQPIGEATLLLTAHFHHLKVMQSGIKTWIQIPALDNGSRWWTEKTGNEAPAGLVTLTVGSAGWDDLKVLTAA